MAKVETQNTDFMFKQNIELEGIFMPHARKKRDSLYEKQPDGLTNGKEYAKFVHYTSAEAALKIIGSKRLWMRNTTCMTDYREVQHGFDILYRFFSNEDKKKSFISALDECHPNAAAQAIDLFDKWYKDIYLQTYITSISEHDQTEDLNGRLSMWRAFGGNTARVAIVLNIPWRTSGAEALKVMFSPVAYLTEEKAHELLGEVIKNIKANCYFLSSLDSQIIINWVFHMLVAGVTCLKHDGFKEEREWRAIYNPTLNHSTLMEFSTEIIGGVPQKIYKLPLDKKFSESLTDLEFSQIFDRLIIGASPYQSVMYEAFSDALEKAGVSEPMSKVWVSGIPIRS